MKIIKFFFAVIGTLGFPVQNLKSFRKLEGGVWYRVRSYMPGSHFDYTKWLDSIPKRSGSSLMHIPLEMEDYTSPRKEALDLIEASKKILDQSGVCSIQQAITFAENAHKEQLREGGQDYVCHPLRVALAVSKYEYTDMVATIVAIVSAILHDTVEDTDVTIDDVRAYFGKKVASIVEALSLRFEGEEDKIYLARVAGGGETSIIIKREDMLDNINSLKEADEAFFKDNVSYYERKPTLWGKIDPQGVGLIEKAIQKAKEQGFKMA